MTFQSLQFIPFLILVATVCWVLRTHAEWRRNVLLVASYLFYAAWDWRLISLLLFTTGTIHFTGSRIALAPTQGQRKTWLGLALIVGVGNIAGFKYSNFFLDSLENLLQHLGLQVDFPTLRLLVPLGISFYTFQALSYVLDIYRGKLEPAAKLRDLALFVAFFPTVSAGPITRGQLLLPQFLQDKPLQSKDVDWGVAMVLRGLVKKGIFADTLARQLVDPAFANPSQYSPLYLALALYAYTFQIYVDVSAYTDIARGAARMCGYELPENFAKPYLARTVSEFWRRWHMTMSQFFRDYVFFSLGGSRKGNLYVNTMLTFLAIGLWHGAGWNFVVYGFIHGSAVCLESWWRRTFNNKNVPEFDPPLWVAIAQVALTFHVVVLSRVLFRASDLGHAAEYLSAMTRVSQQATPVGALGLSVLIASATMTWLFPSLGDAALKQFCGLPVAVQGAAMAILVYLLVAFGSGDAPFIYFKF